MRIVNLVSGGLDSTLIGVLLREQGFEQFPLFIDYGQRAAGIEWRTCQAVHVHLGLPAPVKMDLAGFGQVICSGLTNVEMDVKENAFTPGRNFLFLLMASSYAFQKNATAVSIGLLTEELSLFPDQRSDFIFKAEIAIQSALGRTLKITTPLSDFTKPDVVRLAEEKGIQGTYSCHVGTDTPCGICISCMEFDLND